MRRLLPLAIAAALAAGPGTALAAREAPLPSRLDTIVAAANDPANGYVLVEAHRGAWTRDIPENSLRAIDHAIEVGADIIEIDVRRTADGKLVLMHDASIDRTTTGTGKVEKLTWREIRAKRLRTDDGRATAMRVPTLTEALKRIRGRSLARIDVKCADDCLDPIYAEVDRLGLLDHLVADARSRRFFVNRDQSRVIDLGSDVPITANTSEIGATVDLVWVKDFPADTPPLPDMGRLAPRVRLFAQPYNDKRAGGRGDDRSATDPDQGWGWLLDRGVSALLTNQPEALVDYLEKRGRRQTGMASGMEGHASETQKTGIPSPARP